MDTIYLDHAATTPLRPEVREAMARCHDADLGNPSSTHRVGRAARAALEDARSRVAGVLGVSRREVHFVRGGTESDNLAVLGRADADRARGVRPHVVTTALEHKAVLDAARHVAATGGRCTVLPVDARGRVDTGALEEALQEGASVVSAMWVNNEVGTVQDLPSLVAAAHDAGVPVHTDAVQAVGKVPVDLEAVPADLVSVTGHKLGGPTGTGLLILRGEVAVAPRLHGGSQESGLRPGTQDVAGAVGMAEAVALAVEEQSAFARRVGGQRDRLEAHLRASVAGLTVHGAGGERAPHILNVGVPRVDGDVLQATLDLEGLAVSSGSACQSGSTAPSHVLAALLGEDDLPDAAIRFSLGRTTTDADVDAAAQRAAAVLARLRTVPA